MIVKTSWLCKSCEYAYTDSCHDRICLYSRGGRQQQQKRRRRRSKSANIDHCSHREFLLQETKRVRDRIVVIVIVVVIRKQQSIS